ncbi:MAG: fibronectin type III domain-containing protein, partial [bacterium]
MAKILRNIIQTKQIKAILLIIGLQLFCASLGQAIYTLANPPSDITIDELNLDRITISWNGNEGSYFDAVCSDSSDFTSNVVVVTLTDETTTFDGLTRSTMYWFKVRGYNGDGVPTAYATAVFAQTLSGPVYPYIIHAPDYLMPGGRYPITVDAYTIDGQQRTEPHEIQFSLPERMLILEGNDGLVIINEGTAQYTLYLQPDIISGINNISVQDAHDSNLSGNKQVMVNNRISGFDIEVPGAEVKTAGQSFPIIVTAIDESGSRVRGYTNLSQNMGDVQFSAEIGNAEVVTDEGGSFIKASSFNQGIAVVEVILYGTSMTAP